MNEIVYQLEDVVKCYGDREVCRIDRLEIKRDH